MLLSQVPLVRNPNIWVRLAEDIGVLHVPAADEELNLLRLIIGDHILSYKVINKLESSIIHFEIRDS